MEKYEAHSGIISRRKICVLLEIKKEL